MSERNDVGIGRLIEGEKFRDAVHVAIYPAIAGQMLAPGQRVSCDEQGKAWQAGKPIGIVDPFLHQHVQSGNRFWLFLFPNTVTGMRHEWRHPDIKPAAASIVPSATEVAPDDRKAAAMDFLEGVAGQANRGVDELIEIVGDGTGHMNTGSNQMDVDMEEFWKSIEIVTGKKIPEKKRDFYFACAC